MLLPHTDSNSKSPSKEVQIEQVNKCVAARKKTLFVNGQWPVVTGYGAVLIICSINCAILIAVLIAEHI